jgi:hypothetical protein
MGDALFDRIIARLAMREAGHQDARRDNRLNFRENMGLNKDHRQDCTCMKI